MKPHQLVAWTPEAIATLTRLWDSGLTTGRIANVLGTSRNSIIGKARRLKLTPRPSPIIGAKQPPVVHQRASQAYHQAAGLTGRGNGDRDPR